VLYLASPYTHPDPLEMEYKFKQVSQAVASLMNRGEIIFSPIAYCHPLAVAHEMPRDWEFWQRYCLAMLAKADEMWVLELDGWHKSTGVAAEIVYAINNNIPVCFLSLEEVGLRG